MTARRSPLHDDVPGHVEHQLTGGTANRGLVVRVGDTVRRPLRARSASTHALLHHLEEVGFPGAPRFLGIDRQGREVLSFIEGEAVLPPYPPWAMTDEALSSVARLLRAFHDATRGFRSGGLAWSVDVPEGHRDEAIICHNDPNLDNVVFRDGRAIALIDFDLSSPGSRVWDVATAARLWAPLRTAADIADDRRARSLERFRILVDAYGADIDRDELVAALIPTHDWCYDVVRQGAEDGTAGFVEYWQQGGAARAARTRTWYLREAATLRAALG